MKLYDSIYSSNCRRVRMLLAEKQVDYERVDIDLMKGEQFSDTLKAVNPRCIIPVLETDSGDLIAETFAVMYTIEQLHPEPALFGTDPIESGRIMMWEHRAEADGFLMAEALIRNSHEMMVDRAKPGPSPTKQIPELAERGRERLLEFYGEVDGELGKHEYMAGDKFSVADITMLSVVDVATQLGGLKLPEELENLGRWYAAVSSRASASA